MYSRDCSCFPSQVRIEVDDGTQREREKVHKPVLCTLAVLGLAVKLKLAGQGQHPKPESVLRSKAGEAKMSKVQVGASARDGFGGKPILGPPEPELRWGDDADCVHHVGLCGW